MDEDEEQYYIEHEKRVTEEINEFIENYDFQFIDLEGRRLKNILFLQKCNLDMNNIISLNIKSNLLTELASIAMLSKIQILSIADNQLTNLDTFPIMECLTHLDISCNKITNLERLIPSLAQVETLKMHSNSIKSLKPLAHAHKLKEIHAMDNNIQIDELYHLGHLFVQKAFFCIVHEDQTVDVNGNFSNIKNRDYSYIREQILLYLPQTVDILDIQMMENEYYFARKLTWKGFVSQIDMDPIKVSPQEKYLMHMKYELIKNNIDYLLDSLQVIKDINQMLNSVKHLKLLVRINK